MPSPPPTAYILLWFPKPSETFIFNEVVNLRRLGLPLRVYTIYGPWPCHLSPPMRAVDQEIAVERLGLPGLGRVWEGVRWWMNRRPRLTRRLFRQVPWRRWGGIESGGENLYCFLYGFHLARRFLDHGIVHIHAPWALGAATAAMVASRLTGIPYSFTGRAHDIYPPDGLLGEKLAGALFMRCESEAARAHITGLFPAWRDKLVTTYNGVPLPPGEPAVVPMLPPLRLLALGRLVATKGFAFLLRACRLLMVGGLRFHLTLAGDGPLRPWLTHLVRRLGLQGMVSMPGFVTHDQTPALFRSSDIFIMPSVVDWRGNRDGLPTVILEALLHRLPVVATHVAGIGEIIVDGVTGRLVKPRDPSALAQAVKALAADRPLALDMAEKGRRRVLADFNPEVNHRRVLELYRRLAAPAGDHL